MNRGVSKQGLRVTWLALIATLGMSGCGAKLGKTATSSRTHVASAGVAHKGLATVLREHWEAVMRASPEWASNLGDHRYDDLVRDRSVAAADAWTDKARAFLDRAEALDTADMSSRDAMYHQLFIASLQDSIAEEPCRFETWSVSPRMNALVDIQSALAVQSIDTPSARDAYLARVRAWSESVGPHIEALRTGLAAGRVANATSLRLVVEMMDSQLGQAATSWPMYRVPDTSADALRFGEELAAVIEQDARPALEQLVAVLRDELLPAGRGDDAPGLASLEGGEACYAARVRTYTTLDLDAATLHQRGLDELAKIHAEFVQPGASVFGVWDRALLFERMRTDASLYFESEDEIVDKARRALEAANKVVPTVFRTLPETPCEVDVIPEYEAPYTTIAYYRPPPADGSKPGTYFVNTYAPETRPRHEAEVLAFHESVPGHHLQIALSYELPEVPAFHRFSGTTVFVEGWALYTERLADELSLYSGQTDRLGMLSFDAWRAARLAVDTGIHHLGWSRDEAISFMMENTPLPKNNIVNEVDRYITWPGQALAYKTGQMELWALRRDAEARLGDAFDLAGFHEAVLSRGAVSMPVLRQQVEAWVHAVQSDGAP